MKRPPPEPFSLPLVTCPACGHGIDPHGLNPGGKCGVGDEGARPCDCRWSPNDIAAQRLVDGRVMSDTDPTPTQDLVAALASMLDPPKTGTTVGQRTYNYLTLPDLLSEARTKLGAHRIALMQHGIALPQGGVSVTTTLLHASGHTWITDPLELPSQRDPQSVGTVFTYARRYQLAALLGLSGADDTDADPPKPEPKTRTVAVKNRVTSSGDSEPTTRPPDEDQRGQVIAIHARLSQLEKQQGHRLDREERHQLVAGLLGLDILHSLNDLNAQQRRDTYALLTALTEQDGTA